MPDIFDKLQPDDQHSVFAVCRPIYLSTKTSNNVFMTGEKPNIPQALNEWDRLFHIIEALGVQLLEIPPVKGAQDQCFAANVGFSHGKTMVLANYSAPGRDVEVEPARQFFTQAGLQCIQPLFAFEGFADLRKWKTGFYFGGWGQFSDNRAYDWIEQQLGIKIIRIHEINPKTYHADCCIMVVDEENFLVTPGSLDDDSIATLKKCGNVHMTPEGLETTGITNGILIPEKRIMCSGAFNSDQNTYRKAMNYLMETMDKLSYTMVFVEASAFEPSGGDASCLALVMDFNP